MLEDSVEQGFRLIVAYSFRVNLNHQDDGAVWAADNNVDTRFCGFGHEALERSLVVVRCVSACQQQRVETNLCQIKLNFAWCDFATTQFLNVRSLFA